MAAELSKADIGTHVLSTLRFFSRPLAARAQRPETVGELLDKGGKKLTKYEMTKLLTGATVKGLSFRNTRYLRENTLNDDGSIVGSAVRVGTSRRVAITGAWWISESGQLCLDRKDMSTGKHAEYCGSFFVFDDAYFESRTESRFAPVFARAIKH